MGKSENSGFSETIAASHLKASRSSHLIEYTRYVSIEGQGHILTLAQGCVHTKIQTRFSQKLLYQSEPFFFMKAFRCKEIKI